MKSRNVRVFLFPTGARLALQRIPTLLRAVTVLLIFGGCLRVLPAVEPDWDSRGDQFTICRVKYHGGGDWYSDPSSLPNLLLAVQDRLGMPATTDEAVRELSDESIRRFPFLYMTGHGTVVFTDTEVHALHSYLEDGGFLWVDDNYGMDKTFRGEIRKVFPEKEFLPLDKEHPLFHCFYDLPDGLPAIHEHEPEKYPEALALFHEGRIVVLYTYESDIGDGLEDPDVHGDPPDKREAAVRMALNIVWYAMTH